MVKLLEMESGTNDATPAEPFRGSGSSAVWVIGLLMALFLVVGWLSSRSRNRAPALSDADRVAAAQLCSRAEVLAADLTLESVGRSRDLLNECIERFPGWSEAYLGLARLHRESADRFMLPREAMPQAAAALESMLNLNMHPGGVTELALYKMLYDWDWVGAEKEFQAALARHPGDPISHAWYARLLQAQHRLSEARLHAEAAHGGSNPPIFSTLVLSRQRMLEGNPADASRCLESALAQQPRPEPLVYAMASHMAERGEHGAALEFLTARATSTNSLDFLAWSGFLLSRTGRTNEARLQLQNIKAISREKYVSPFYPAIVCIGLGRKREALVHLGNAYTYRCAFMLGLRMDYPLNELANEPYCRDLARRIGVQ